MRHLYTNTRKGFSLVEVLLAGVIFGLFVTAFVSAYLYGEEATMLAGNRARASFLAEEGMEAVRNIRDAGFSNLTDGTYGLSTSGNQWSLSGSQDTNGIFTRTVTISPVDSKRKNVTVNISWQQNAQRAGAVSLVSRFTNWIVAGIGNWSNPIKTGILNISGNNNGFKIATQGDYAYVVMEAGTPNFFVMSISNPDVLVQVGSLTLTGTPRNVEVSGNYAYVASTHNAEELQIIDVSSPASPVKVGVYNAPGNSDGSAVDLSGNTAYLVRTSSASDEFVVVNVTSKVSPVGLGSVNLGSNANGVDVSGSYAYVTSASDTQELQVVSISNPNSPALIGSYNISGNNDGIAVATFDTTVVVGTLTSGYLGIFDVSVPASPVQVGFYTGGGSINDISLGSSNTYAFLATDVSSAELQIVDISNPASPVLFGSFDVSGTNNLNGVSYHVVNDRAYAVGDSNTEEVIVIAPQ